ncbi:MAG: WXG100 family type VII secretion target [Agathobacter sp.]|nr:WXG100 family type VII secretion target [Agathobacter sp.]
MSEFNSADIEKIATFINESDNIKTEFEEIIKEFKRINKDLLASWKGEGADAYKKETDHILEKIDSVDTVLDELTTGVITDIRDNYSELDRQLGEFNENPYEEGEEE